MDPQSSDRDDGTASGVNAAIGVVDMPASGHATMDLKEIPGFSFVHKPADADLESSQVSLTASQAKKKRTVPPGSQIFQQSMGASDWRYNGQYYARTTTASNAAASDCHSMRQSVGGSDG